MDTKSRIIKLIILLAMALALCACSNKQPQEASPTPYMMPYTAMPTEIALPEDVLLDIPDIEQMKAQVTKGTPWYVRVDACNQLISVYALDENKRYTYLVNRFICSTPGGLSKMLLQSGQGCPLQKAQMLADASAQGYFNEFSLSLGNQLLLRSVPIKEGDRNLRDGNVYNNLTLNTQKPYIVLSAEDAEWLYDNLQQGVFFEVVYDSPDPGLVQSLMPMPCIDGCGLSANTAGFTICRTSEPKIAWSRLNEALFTDSGSE